MPVEQVLPDTEIIDRILAGESRLLEVLIRRNNAALYRIGRSYHLNHHDTEDLMQETWVAAFQSLSRFEHRSTFRTWLSRVMINQCYHRKTKKSYNQEVIMENQGEAKVVPLFHQSAQESNPVYRELGNVLEHAISSIPEDYRMVFALRELNGLSVEETGEVLGITESNVKVRLNRARKMLRTQIEKLYSPQDIYEFNLRYCDRMVERVMAQVAILTEAHP